MNRGSTQGDDHRERKMIDTLISSRDLEQALNDIAERARVVAESHGVSLILVESGLVQTLITAGIEKPTQWTDLIRSDGLSFEVLRTGEPKIIDDVGANRNEVNSSKLWSSIGAALCLPIILDGDHIGVMWFYYKESRHFSTEIRTLQLCADQVASTYERFSRIWELDYIRQAMESLAEAGSQCEALKEIARGMCQVLGTDSVVIWPFDDDRKQFIPEELVSEGIPLQQCQEFGKLEAREGGTAHTVMTQKWTGVIDIQNPGSIGFRMGTSTRNLLGAIGVRSFCGIALQMGSEKLGVLYANYNCPQAFGMAKRRSLEIFASHAAFVLKNARLKVQRERTKQAAAAIAGATIQEDLRQTLQTIAQHTQECLHSDAVTIYAYDETKQVFYEWATQIHDPRDLDASCPPHELTELSATYRILKLEQAPYYVLAEDSASQHPSLGGYYVDREQIHAAFGMQVRVGEHHVGVMFVNFRTPHHFTSDEIAIIRLFADQAAVAIRNAELYRRSQQRAKILESLYKAGQAVTGSLDVDHVLRQIVEQAWEVVEPLGEKRAQFSVLALRESDILRFTATYPVERMEELAAEIDFINLKCGYKGKVGIIGRAVLTEQTQLVGDVTCDPDYILIDRATKSQMAAPLVVGDEVIGAISVEHPQQNAFDSEDQQALEALASQAALAIANVRLYQAERHRVRELSGLYEISKAIGLVAHLPSLYQQINESMASLMSVTKCAILLYDDAKQSLVCQMPTYGFTEDFARSYCLPASPGQLATIWNESDSLILNYAEQDPLTKALGLEGFVRESDTRHTLLAKLVSGNKNIGVVQVSDKLDQKPFTDDDGRLLSILAVQVAGVIENAQLYEDLRQAYEDLRQTKMLVAARTSLAWMGMTSSAWRHAIDKHALTIRDLVLLLSQELDQGASLSSNARIEERLAAIDRMANQILEKPITPPLSSAEGVKTVSLTGLVGERARQLWRNDPYRKTVLKLDLQLADYETVEVSPEWLRRALDILIDNAVDAVADCKIQEVTIGTRVAERGAEIFVSDTGKGIPEEIQAKIGLEPIEKPEDAKGLGMGLLIAQIAAQTYGGRIRIESTSSTGTTMVVWLPTHRSETEHG